MTTVTGDITPVMLGLMSKNKTEDSRVKMNGFGFNNQTLLFNVCFVWKCKYWMLGIVQC